MKWYAVRVRNVLPLPQFTAVADCWQVLSLFATKTYVTKHISLSSLVLFCDKPVDTFRTSRQKRQQSTMNDNKPKSKKKTAENTCVVPGCGNARKICGNCQACYSSHRRAVERGETTWAGLIAAGLSLPRRTTVAADARAAAGLDKPNA
jgi:hypothetical protein